MGLSDGLVACYRLDGNLNDSTGQGNDLSTALANTYGPGLLGSALVTGDGTRNVVRNLLTTPTGWAFTLTGWFFSPTSFQNGVGPRVLILTNGGGIPLVRGAVIGINSDPTNGHYLVFGVGDTLGLDQSPGDIDPSNWHFAAMSVTSANVIKTYADGVLLQTTRPLHFSTFTQASVTIQNDLSDSIDFTTPTDQAMIWNRVLSDLEIKQLYNGGKGLDPSFRAEVNNPTFLASPGVRGYYPMTGVRSWLAGE